MDPNALCVCVCLRVCLPQYHNEIFSSSDIAAAFLLVTLAF